MTVSLYYAIDRTDRIILLKKELDRLGIPLLKPDINYSGSKFIIESNSSKKKSIRFSLSAIKGVGSSSMDKLVLEREKNNQYTVDYILMMDKNV